ncbi:MAG TPA: CRISPR-associated endonuclease Cas2 [Candidatus Paceibacterota bacterium]|nr:CRISPR-associated endonuclease Cas2 [Candidatus Paceibacterota bacterium]
MGALEKEASRTRKLQAFQRGLLVATALGGVVLVAAAIPNAARLLRYMPGYHKKGARFNYQAKTALQRLAAKGLVTFEERKGKRYARVTEAGERMLALESMREKGSRKRRRWDGRWRVVLFDIPERRRGTRNRLRSFMQEYGFVRLQDSAWIYPYDCEDLIALAKANLRVGFDVLYMIVERLERDSHLRARFGLRSS